MVQHDVEFCRILSNFVVPGERGSDLRPAVIWATRIGGTAAVKKGVHARAEDPGVGVASEQLVAAVAARGGAVGEEGVIQALKT